MSGLGKLKFVRTSSARSTISNHSSSVRLFWPRSVCTAYSSRIQINGLSIHQELNLDQSRAAATSWAAASTVTWTLVSKTREELFELSARLHGTNAVSFYSYVGFADLRRNLDKLAAHGVEVE